MCISSALRNLSPSSLCFPYCREGVDGERADREGGLAEVLPGDAALGRVVDDDGAHGRAAHAEGHAQVQLQGEHDEAGGVASEVRDERQLVEMELLDKDEEEEDATLGQVDDDNDGA